jgi:hypothetical protein
MSKTLTFSDSEIAILLDGIAAIRRANPMAEGLTERLNPLERKLTTAKDNYASIWSVEDVHDMIEEDEATDGLGGETISVIAQSFFRLATWSMDDILGQRGNDYLQTLWDIERNHIISEVLKSQIAE